jgi:hypothetical protein
MMMQQSEALDVTSVDSIYSIVVPMFNMDAL